MQVAGGGNGTDGRDITTLHEYWRSQRTVVIFMRRFQCPYCKMTAMEASNIRAKLAERNVRLVGIGSGDSGLKEFQVYQVLEAYTFKVRMETRAC